MSNQIQITAYPATAVATSGTITFTYPSGYSKASFEYGGATLWVEGHETLYTEGSSNFSVVYGASDATVTYLGSTSIAANARVVFNPTLVRGEGVIVVPFYVNLAEITGNGDVLTNYTPGFRFKVLGLDFNVVKPVTTTSKRADFNVEIGATNVTGGVVSVTSAAATPQGTVIAGSAVTAANTGGANDTISIEAASVTAHAEGSGWLLLKLRNLDTYDGMTSRYI